MIPATVQLTQLNRRINDGGQEDGSESVYLWVIMFALDGTNISQNGLSLSGSPQWFFGQGSDGNLNQDISQGQGIPVPPSVGTWFLNLSPIVITDPTTSPPSSTDVPPTIGVVAVLMDAGATPTEDMEAGHQALNNFVQSEINNFVSGLNLLTLSLSIDSLVKKGESVATATATTIQTLLAPVVATIQGQAQSIVYNAVVNALGVGGEILSGIDPDTQIGSQNLIITQSQLMNLDPDGERSYTAYAFQMQYPTSNDTYYLYGFAQNRNQVVNLTPGVPPGRWQVTGVNKGFSNGLRSSYIKEIGGQLPDGSQWFLERSTAVALIQSGINSFFVNGADGSSSDVIVSDAPIDGVTDLETYLTTTPDRSLEDNLDSLPPFSLTTLVPGQPSP